MRFRWELGNLNLPKSSLFTKLYALFNVSLTHALRQKRRVFWDNTNDEFISGNLDAWRNLQAVFRNTLQVATCGIFARLW